MNTVASSRNLRPNGLKTDRILQFLVGLVVCVWLVYQVTHLQLGSVRTKIRENVVSSLGRKEMSGKLNARGENLKVNILEGEMVEGESSAEGENIQVDLQGGERAEIGYSDETNKNDEGSSSNQVDLQGGKRAEIAYSDETNKNDEGSSSNQVDLQGGKRTEIAYSDETNKNDEGSSSNQVDLQDGKRAEIAFSDETNKNNEGSSSKASENLLETVISSKESDGKDVLQDKDEPGIDQEGEENGMTQNTIVKSQNDVFGDSHSFHDENGIPKEMRDGKSAGSSSLNDQSESS